MRPPVGRLGSLGEKETLHWVGLMSGTSGDGIDAVRIEIKDLPVKDLPNWRPKIRLLQGQVLPFPEPMRGALQRDLSSPLSVARAAYWDAQLGSAFATAAEGLVQDQGVDAVALSGHTFAHHPDQDPPTTLQLGNPALVAERTGLPVVAGFRASDVARGGEGAPLVPAGDRLLFGDPEQDVAVLNLGGISNLTWLPAGFGMPRAADCGPGNLILNQIMRSATGGTFQWDNGGALALRGQVHRKSVETWLQDSFFLPGAQRSTGREQFGERWVLEHGDELAGLELPDRLATVVAWIVEGISLSLERLGEGRIPHFLWVGGGGAHNLALLKALEDFLPLAPQALRAKSHCVDADTREAVCFALLGHLW
ncbi:MAG: anhydro-N-acetylmuramic acid kinase, partial [Planctomycetota bacterium]